MFGSIVVHLIGILINIYISILGLENIRMKRIYEALVVMRLIKYGVWGEQNGRNKC